MRASQVSCTIAKKISDQSVKPYDPSVKDAETTSELSKKKVKTFSEVPEKPIRIASNISDKCCTPPDQNRDTSCCDNNTETSVKLNDKNTKLTIEECALKTTDIKESDKKVKIISEVPERKIKIASETSEKISDYSIETSAKLPDKNTKLKIEESAPKTNKSSEIEVKKFEEVYDLTAQNSVADDLSSQKTKELSDKIVAETKTVLKQTDKKIEPPTSSPPVQNIDMDSATTSKEGYKMLMSPVKLPESTQSLQLDATEEPCDPERNCVRCVEEGKVCMRGCPTADKKRNQSKK